VAQTKTRPASRSTTTRRNAGKTTRPTNAGNGRTRTGSRSIDGLGGDVRKAGRRTSRRAVRAYESTWAKVADLEDRVADKSPVDWITDVARAQARVTRKVSHAYSLEARKLIG
jgi:hypothetical protein